MPWLVTLLSAAIALLLRGAEAFLHPRTRKTRRIYAALFGVWVLFALSMTLFRTESDTVRIKTEAFAFLRKFAERHDFETFRAAWMNVLLFLPGGMFLSGMLAPRSEEGSGMAFRDRALDVGGIEGLKEVRDPEKAAGEPDREAIRRVSRIFGGCAKTRLLVTGAGLAASLLIEAVQLLCRLGTFETDDLIANTFGAMLGALPEVVAGFIAWILARRPKAKIPRKFVELLNRLWHVVSYIFWGGTTTLVNWLVYFSLEGRIHYLAANTAAWVISVTFAFLANRAFVFRSGSRGLRLVREGLLFAAGRLFSLGVETGLMWLGVDLLKFPSAAVKVVVAASIAVMNFLVGKFIVFGEKRSKKTPPEPEDF